MKQPAGVPSRYVETSPGVWCHPSRIVGAVAAPKPKPQSGGTLDQDLPGRCGGKAGLAGGSDAPSGRRIQVDLIAFLRRRCDDDNITAGCKPLRDAVAATLGVDDGDPRVTFAVHQVVGPGEEGTLVRITIGA